MITKAQARQQYEAARDALNLVARSDSATAAQRDDARAARDELTFEYIGKAVGSVEELTAQYESFIERMSTVLQDLSGNSDVARGLLQLQNVVEFAGKFKTGQA